MVRVIQLVFEADPVTGERKPKDAALFSLAQEFAKKELAQSVDLTLMRTWAACRMDSEDRPIEVLAMAAVQMVPEVSIFRTKRGPHSSKATLKLWQRLNDYFADLGLRGCEVLLFLAAREPEESRCKDWRSWLKLAGAKESDRVAVKIR